MDVQTFLDNFSTIADAPGGVQRLRNLVLELAVTGRLVPHETDAHAANRLISEAVDARADLVTRGLVPKPRAFTADEDPPSFVLPSTWAWTDLENISVYIQRGKSPRYASAPTSTPVVSQKCVQWSGFDLGPARYVVEESLPGYGPERFLQAGDLLWNSTGTGTVGRVVAVPDGLPVDRVVADSHVTVVRLANCHPQFVRAWLASAFVQSRIEELTSGTTQQQELNTSTVRGLGVPVPSRPEQERIVAKVDELMVLCDDFEARQERRHQATTRFRSSALHSLTEAETPDDLHHAWEHLDRSWSSLTCGPDSVPDLRQAILRLAVEGRLLEQSPATEDPAERLLDQLAEKRGAAGAPLPSEERPGLPAGWAWASFGQATINRDAERVPLKRAARSQRPGQYDYYGASGVIDQIDDYIFDGDLLLIGEDGANLVLRSTPIAFIASGRFWVNNHAHVLESVELDALKYLAIFINSIDLRPHLTGIAQPKLNQARMNRIAVPLPPLAEQRRIVERVDQLVGMCDELGRILTRQESTLLELAVASCRSIM